MKGRHEWKHEITVMDYLEIRMRMKAVASVDPHAKNGKYRIRSLYFDTPTDKALREKIDGVANREKFRIRFYNNDVSLIHLEKKAKHHELGYKTSVSLTSDEAKRIAEGEIGWMQHDERDLLRELHFKMITAGLAAKTIVDYEREPFVFVPGNVRVTLDHHIKTGGASTDFLNPDVPMVPVEDNPIILEVKWDDYLPDIIRMAVGLYHRRVQAYSKYAAARMYD